MYRLLSTTVAVLLLAGACTGNQSTPVLQGAQPAETQLEHTIDEGRPQRVAEVRQLNFLRQVKSDFLSAEEMEEFLRTRMEQAREKILALEQLYRTLELTDESLELYPFFVDMVVEQVRGVLNPDAQELKVLQANGQRTQAEEELTLVHELTHALQQQHFDVQKLLAEVEGQIDQARALAALMEGDATFARLLYQSAYSISIPAPPSSPLLDSAPTVIQETFLFPYVQGLGFVMSLWERSESWQDVNESYTSPPLSTEQVLHPEKYLAGEAPIEVILPELLPALGPGWEEIMAGVAGEFLLAVYLNSALATPLAQEAATGWGGDRFVLYRNEEGQRALVLLTQWDTTEEAEEFFDSYQQFTEATAWEQRGEGPSSMYWGRPGRWVHLDRVGDRVLVILAPSQQAVASLTNPFSEF